jgi:hypothetical protein
VDPFYLSCLFKNKYSTFFNSIGTIQSMQTNFHVERSVGLELDIHEQIDITHTHIQFQIQLSSNFKLELLSRCFCSIPPFTFLCLEIKHREDTGANQQSECYKLMGMGYLIVTEYLIKYFFNIYLFNKIFNSNCWDNGLFI